MLVPYWSILVPRASRSRTSSLGPGTHGTGSARKLAVVSKVPLELLFSTRNNFHSVKAVFHLLLPEKSQDKEKFRSAPKIPPSGQRLLR